LGIKKAASSHSAPLVIFITQGGAEYSNKEQLTWEYINHSTSLKSKNTCQLLYYSTISALQQYFSDASVSLLYKISN
jgi:hypothetical protein